MSTKGKILIVDDELAVCKVLSLYFKKRNYPVAEAHSGKEALEKVRDEGPKFILLDYLMPGLNGLEVLEQIKKEWPDKVVIMMTGVDEEWIYEKARALGVYDFLMKPLDYEYLEKLIVTKLI
ncbi:MAG: response regulator [Candidatus Omnitrophica bacterium]|nr:response regulator [Candidatus Omnitrophota bacterium]